MRHFAWIALLLAASADAAVYKCEMPDGRMAYQSQPCPKGAASEQLDIRVNAPSKNSEDVDPEAKKLEAELSRKEWLLKRAKKSAMQEHIWAKRVAIGMTKEQVISSWGRPDDINKTISSSGTSEQWVYERDDYQRQYVYFDDGEVSYISD